MNWLMRATSVSKSCGGLVSARLDTICGEELAVEQVVDERLFDYLAHELLPMSSVKRYGRNMMMLMVVATWCHMIIGTIAAVATAAAAVVVVA